MIGESGNAFGGLLILLFYFACFVAGPIITIWALNTLFALGIAYGFYEWVAVLCLGGGGALLKRVTGK